ncbi:ankyrin [Corynespora cassiicola Philippines]|uniref:Ankyrin n=1 Tax=Corynespora cassiicola Philippines TaxID=1448308 RepID=A0A2T2P1J0_CORCC|nr:ankyrin [Corynespora cassiicola Philippines]
MHGDMLSSYSPLTKGTGNASCQRKRSRATLKCNYCRIKKKKCQPKVRKWPGERCSLCLKDGDPCSKGHYPPKNTALKPERLKNIAPAFTNGSVGLPASLAPTHLPVHMSSHLGPNPNIQPYVNSTLQKPLQTSQIYSSRISEVPGDIKRSLLFLGLRTIISMALKELRKLCEDMASPMLQGPHSLNLSECLPNLVSVFNEYERFLSFLNWKITREPSKDLLFRAVYALFSGDDQKEFTLSDNNNTTESLQQAIQEFENLEHYEFSHVLRMKALLEEPEPTRTEIERFVNCRAQFLDEFERMVESGVFEDQEPPSLRHSQVFIPSKLLRIPAIADQMMRRELPDCLDRSISHLLSDSGLSADWYEGTVNNIDVLGRNGAYVACQKGNEPLVRMLLKLGANFNQAALNQFTPLHIAASMGHKSICEIIYYHYHRLNFKPLPVKRLFPHHLGRSLSMWAALGGHQGTAKFFRDQIQSPPDEKDNFGMTELGLAAYSGHLDIIKHCVSTGSAVDIPDVKGRTPLWYAAHQSHYATMEYLEGLGANIDSKDNDGLTPLATAAHRGHADIVRYLLSFNTYDAYRGVETKTRVDINSLDHDSNCPLLLAIKARRASCVHKLLKHAINALRIESLLEGLDIATENRDWETLFVMQMYQKQFYLPRENLKKPKKGPLIGHTTTCLGVD